MGLPNIVKEYFSTVLMMYVVCLVGFFRVLWISGWLCSVVLLLYGSESSKLRGRISQFMLLQPNFSVHTVL